MRKPLIFRKIAAFLLVFVILFPIGIKMTAMRVHAKNKKKKVKKMEVLSVGGAPSEMPLKIIGDNNCRDQVAGALENLRDHDEDAYQRVLGNIGIVECSADGSGTFVWESPARIKLGQATRASGPVWLAGVMSHESCHAGQYKDYRLSHPDSSVPTEIYSGAEAESQCLHLQYQTLSRVGSGKSTLEYVKQIAATSYWDIPYEKRWW